jgi:hypothetical protein
LLLFDERGRAVQKDLNPIIFPAHMQRRKLREKQTKRTAAEVSQKKNDDSPNAEKALRHRNAGATHSWHVEPAGSN